MNVDATIHFWRDYVAKGFEFIMELLLERVLLTLSLLLLSFVS